MLDIDRALREEAVMRALTGLKVRQFEELHMYILDQIHPPIPDEIHPSVPD